MPPKTNANVEPLQHLPGHWILYGDFGQGKSTGASTFPKPMLVYCFDPFGKETPYLRRGTPSELGVTDLGVPYREVVSKKGELLIRIEYYHDIEPTHPTAYATFLKRMVDFQREYDQWKTVVVDSITFMELCSRKWNQYVLNPFPMYAAGKDMRQWFGGSTENLEEMLMMRFGALPMNVVIIAHVDEDKDEVMGAIVRNVNAPGRLRKRLAIGYSEVYHAFAQRGEDSRVEYWWQTRPDRSYAASSQIGAPDPCPPTYSAIWQPGG